PAEYRNWEWRHFHSQLDGARTVLRPRTGPMDLSRDVKRLAFVTPKQTVRLWDVQAGKDVTVLRAPAGGLAWVAFRPDGRRLATGRDRLRIWDAVTGELCWEAPARKEGPAVLDLFWSPDGRYVAELVPGRLRVWDSAAGTEVFRLDDAAVQRR